MYTIIPNHKYGLYGNTLRIMIFKKKYIEIEDCKIY